jgi:hypothetical protein
MRHLRKLYSSGSEAKHAKNAPIRRPISQRIPEALRQDRPRLRLLSRERIARRLDKASEIAEAQDNAQGMVAAEMGIAKVFGHASEDTGAAPSFQDAQSMQDIGRKLLISVGCQEPDDVSISEAIEAKDAFISRARAFRRGRFVGDRSEQCVRGSARTDRRRL